ncbi:MAG TPA: J domain-containing protein [Bryobacteraceae bacterium]|jgi:DnaJ-domain-containing protein 1|nr:J domain-containing protein [Bryobacteraceae bacterium]
MQSAAGHAGFRVRESPDAGPELTIILDSSGNPSSRLLARFLAHGENSIQIQLGMALGLNLLVSIAGEVDTGSGRAPLLGHYRVRSCIITGIGKYRAELTPEPATAERPEEPTARRDRAEDADYYEILQVSRQADADTIRRVFHALAARYHPDNKDTGSDLRFRQLVEANNILSDPEKRAAYDVRLADEDKTRFRIFNSAQSSEGVEAELRKRQGILRLLYTKRLRDPRDAGLRGRDFTEMLGVPDEHLEFALWFLRETRRIHRSDNNRFEITCSGVELFEAEQTNLSKKQLITLPAPA